MRTRRSVRWASLLLAILVLVVSLSACGGKVEPQNINYDPNTYTLCTNIDGVSFLVPRSLDDSKEDYSNYDQYSSDQLIHHSFEWASSTGNVYELLRPGFYGCYAFSLGKIDHAEGERNAEQLPSYLGIDENISLQPRGKHPFSASVNADGDIRNVFAVVIQDQDLGSIWYGYFTFIKDFDTGHIYCFANGYANEEDAAQAKPLADSFQLTD